MAASSALLFTTFFSQHESRFVAQMNCPACRHSFQKSVDSTRIAADPVTAVRALADAPARCVAGCTCFPCLLRRGNQARRRRPMELGKPLACEAL